MDAQLAQGLTYMDPAQLREAEDNPRTITDDRYQELCYALEHDPQMLEARPIILDADRGDVPCGNMRLRASRDVLERIPDGRLAGFVNGHGGLPVYIKRFVSPAERREWMLRDNQGYGDWVDEALARMVADHQQDGADMALLGFAEPEVDALLGMLNDGGGDAGSPGGSAVTPSLAQRFVVPPFTILDARSGTWRERKREWMGLGLQSELGRDGTPKTAYADDSSGDPRFYEAKRQVEERLGRQLTTAEFIREHYQDSRGDGSSLANSNVSVFDPVLCELAYRWYTGPNDHVLDPFAGGSVRGIVAAVTQRSYVGVDLRPEQVAANEEQAQQLLDSGRHPWPVWAAGDARTVGEQLADQGPFDYLFTCPPYYDLEVYSDDPRDLSRMDGEAFEDAWGASILEMAKLLADDRFATVVIGDVRGPDGHLRPFLKETMTNFALAGCRLYNMAVLVTPVGSVRILAAKQFVASRKLGRTHQYVLTFCKGDPVRAAQRCGDADATATAAAAEEAPA